MPLKGPEKICRPHYFLGLPLKGFSLCLGILATRKRVHEFLDAYLVGYLIFLQLVLYVGFGEQLQLHISRIRKNTKSKTTYTKKYGLNLLYPSCYSSF